MASKRGRQHLIAFLLMNLLSYYQLDYQGVDLLAGESGTLEHKPNRRIKTIVPQQFEKDVKALCNYAELSELASGMVIKMSLQEALSVMPRKRARIDSYKLLVRFLNDEMGVTLVINSNKTKQNEE